jgi:hypothetical protein
MVKYHSDQTEKEKIKMLKCKVCDHEFTQEELFKNHTMVKEANVSLISGIDVKYHDAYNCPKCNHQNVIDDVERLEEVNEKVKYCNDSELQNRASGYFECLGNFDYLICEDANCDCIFKDKCLEYSKLKGTTKNPSKAKAKEKDLDEKKLCHNCIYSGESCTKYPCNDCFLGDIDHKHFKSKESFNNKSCNNCRNYGTTTFLFCPCDDCDNCSEWSLKINKYSKE